MIPCVALAALPRKYDIVLASDINLSACLCTQGNMRIVTAPEAFQARHDEIHRRRRINQGMNRRWAVVERYMEQIQPMLQMSPSRAKTGVIRSDAFSLPTAGGEVHFVSDLPHEKVSRLHGGPLSQLIPSLRSKNPDATIVFVTTNEAVDELLSSCSTAECRGLTGGRVIVRA